MKTQKELSDIRAGLSHLPMKWQPSVWLDMKTYLGDKHGSNVNRVMGHRDHGLAYGRMMEVFGWESVGKSSILLTTAALAQRDGAHIIWGDIENSFQADWAIQRGIKACPICKNQSPESCKKCNGTGVDPEWFTLLSPYVGTFGKEKEQRLINAQEQCEEIEACMKLRRKERSVVVIDSIPALETAGERQAGISGRNMRSNLDLPMFLGGIMRRWVGLAQVYNSMIIFVNQLREGPAGFGDPSYTPGGNAPRFYCHVRLRLRRPMGSKITNAGQTIGIKGIMTCVKNKTGGEEASSVGYRLMFNGPIEFVSVKDLSE